jgi:hypothetical protein
MVRNLYKNQCGGFTMIPEIGLMVGSYIFARLLGLILKSPNSYSSMFARGIVVVFSLLSMIVTAFICVDLFTQSSSLGTNLGLP